MEFQKQILMDQRQHVLEQFQQVSFHWQKVKEKMADNLEDTSRAFINQDIRACKLQKV